MANIEYEDFVTALTEETTPDNAADFLVIVDTSGSDVNKVKPSNILGTDLTAIKALTPSNDDVLQRKAGVWTNRTIAQLTSDLAITPNATHTGEVTGSGALTVDKTAITGKTGVSAAVGDSVLISDASDTDALKKATIQSIVDLVPSSNATHTGEVTGATALTVDKTAITGKTLVTAAAGDHVLVADASDSNNLKKVTVQTIVDLAGGSPGEYALEFTSANLSHVNHGVVHVPAATYQTFFMEALLKPTASGYFWSSGKGGNHLILFGVSGTEVNGYILQGNITDVSTVTTTSFQTTETLRHNEWAQVAVAYDGAEITCIINGIPSSIIAATQNRRCDDVYDCVGYVGGSDHLNFGGRIAAIRLFEGGLPYVNPSYNVMRPAIGEMGGSVVYRSSTEVPANFLADYRTGTLNDYSKGLNSRPANGYLYAATGEYPVLGTYSSAGLGDYDATKRPQWVVDAFTYTGAATPATPPANVLFYDSFGRADVHFGNIVTPLGLGALEVGGVSWTGDYYGILNGNAFGTQDVTTPVVFDTSLTNVDVRMTRPAAFSTGRSGTHTLYLRYVDSDNYVQLYRSDANSVVQIIERVAGANNDLGPEAFGANWLEMKAVVNGTTLTVYADGVLKATKTINAALTGTKTGFKLNDSLLRISSFAVYAG